MFRWNVGTLQFHKERVTEDWDLDLSPNPNDWNGHKDKLATSSSKAFSWVAMIVDLSIRKPPAEGAFSS